MRVLVALAAMAFAVAPATDPHAVTLRFDALTTQNPVKVELRSPAGGLHIGNSNAPAQQQVTVTTPASVVIDASVEALMIDVQGASTPVRVSFEQGGSPRELALRIAGTRMMLRRNMDGDLVLGSRVVPAPGFR